MNSNNEILCLCRNRLKECSIPSSKQAFWSFVLYYNKTKMMVIGVPIGLSKLKRTEGKKNLSLFYGSGEMWCKDIAS